jgi:TIR domain-containing protein
MPKRKTTKRTATKRKASKRKPTKRKATTRRATKRKVTKRKATKRKTTKRKATQRKASKRGLAKREEPHHEGGDQKLKVFISWSGPQSETLGTGLGNWLQGIVPDVEPFFSPNVAPGAVWAQKFEDAIQKADYAILCVTKENLDSRWMNFEAGALWKSRDESYVCPLLLKLNLAKLSGGPYTVFQARRFDKKDFHNVCDFLARRTDMDPKRFELNFEANWPKLLKAVRSDLRKLSKRKQPRTAKKTAANKRRVRRTGRKRP